MCPIPLHGLTNLKMYSLFLFRRHTVKVISESGAHDYMKVEKNLFFVFSLSERLVLNLYFVLEIDYLNYLESMQHKNNFKLIVYLKLSGIKVNCSFSFFLLETYLICKQCTDQYLIF